MKRAPFFLLIVLGLFLTVSVTAQRRRKDPCANPQTQAEMNICARNEFKAADIVLNRVYNQLMSKLDDTGKVKLKEAQGAWLKYRDADCDYEASLFEGGSMQPMVLSSCFARVTRARTAELRQQLKELDR